MKTFLELRNVLPLMHESPFHKPLNWTVNEGETWAVVGRNGSGKTLFADVVCGKYNLLQGEIRYPFFEKIKAENPAERLKNHIKTVSFNSVYSIVDFREMYYQQRFNSAESEVSPPVADFFTEEEISSISPVFNTEKLLSRRIIQLSSGELRKLLIAKILLEKPRMIIFDNPFIGLDTASRGQLDELFRQMAERGIMLVFLVPSEKDIPSAVTQVFPFRHCGLVPQSPVSFCHSDESQNLLFDGGLRVKPAMTETTPDYEVVAKMTDLNISYGKNIIAKNINWEVRKGEKWALLGANGSGKSTLLSYIFADNPQAYSKDIVLFDRRRGTGESIWDIKRRIGFTSSEMHLYYCENVPCLKVVESGFFDSIGLFRQCSEEQTRIAEQFFDLLEINHLKDKLFLRISSGEQRLVLFARSLVKNPEVLILDEPFHGLDDENRARCLQIVEDFGKQAGKTLIFVTHRAEEIPKCVDKSFVIANNNILF
ncbi:MAG: ATP-binding cassette domain-containing protein [Prevotellaceae bacterium]|nr:ATP-binding cassette domain-containing protein [Prevotellaceae bacterium]